MEEEFIVDLQHVRLYIHLFEDAVLPTAFRVRVLS